MASEQYFMYKGRPLVRSGNTLYYGSTADKYVVMLQILDAKEQKDIQLSTKVSVVLMLTDPDIRNRDRVVKKSEKGGLYEAMDVGAIWLERALKE